MSHQIWPLIAKINVAKINVALVNGFRVNPMVINISGKVQANPRHGYMGLFQCLDFIC